MNVVICDHQRLFADALASVVDAHAWTIVGTPSDPAHAVALVARAHVDLCLMDLVFPGGATGIYGIAAVRAVSPTTKIVVLTASSDPELIVRAVQSGADGIVFKDDGLDQIIEISEQVVDSHDATAGASDDPRPTSETTKSRAVSGLELQVLDRLLDGARGAALAQALGVSYASVRTRIRNLLRELAGPQLDTIAFAVDDDTRRNGPSREL